jgi:ABC-type amino acid transport system permease subunit
VFEYPAAWITGASLAMAGRAFTLFEAAYFSKIMRAGIQSIQRG